MGIVNLLSNATLVKYILQDISTVFIVLKHKHKIEVVNLILLLLEVNMFTFIHIFILGQIE